MISRSQCWVGLTLNSKTSITRFWLQCKNYSYQARLWRRFLPPIWCYCHLLPICGCKSAPKNMEWEHSEKWNNKTSHQNSLLSIVFAQTFWVTQSRSILWECDPPNFYPKNGAKAEGGAKVRENWDNWNHSSGTWATVKPSSNLKSWNRKFCWSFEARKEKFNQMPFSTQFCPILWSKNFTTQAMLFR